MPDHVKRFIAFLRENPDLQGTQRGHDRYVRRAADHLSYYVCRLGRPRRNWPVRRQKAYWDLWQEVWWVLLRWGNRQQKKSFAEIADNLEALILKL